MKPRILITGFGPFPGQPQNPSLTLVRSLRQIFAGSQSPFTLHAIELKTTYADAWPKLERALDTFKPDIVICFGVAAGEKGFRLEQTARNHCNTTKSDAAGHKPPSAVIQANAPDTHSSSLPLGVIKAGLDQSAILSRLSDDAGDYLCNHVFYKLVAQAMVTGTPAKAGFIHIPVPDQPDALSRAQLIQGAKTIIAACL